MQLTLLAPCIEIEVMRKATFLLLMFFLVGCHGSPGVSEVSIESLEGPIGIDHSFERNDWVGVTRVMDALTGKPLAGARLVCFAPGPLYPNDVLHEVVSLSSDRHGFVRVPASVNKSRHFLFRHGEFGPVAVRHIPEVVCLMPGVDVSVHLLDCFGRSLPGVQVGLRLNTADTPDVCTAVTDASGRASLACVEPTMRVCDSSNMQSISFKAPGLCGYFHEFEWNLGDLPVTVYKRQMPIVRGRFRDPDGKPVPRVAIGGFLGRGPLTWSDARGEFVDVGRPWDEDELCVMAYGRKFDLLPSMLGKELDIVLPKAELLPRPRGRIRLRVRNTLGVPLPEASVVARLPGLVHPGEAEDLSVNGRSAATDADGICTVEVPAGLVELHIRDHEDVLHHEPFTSLISVSEGVEETIDVELVPRQYRQVKVEGEWSDVVLVTAMEEISVKSLVRTEGAVPLPVDQPFALLVECPFAPLEVRRFVFNSVPEGDIHLRAFDVTRVQVRVMDRKKQPIKARLAVSKSAYLSNDRLEKNPDEAVVATSDGGSGTVLTWEVGCAFLHVHPLSTELRSRIVHLSLPALGDGVVHVVGDVELFPTSAPQLRICEEGGRPPGDGRLRVMRPGLVQEFTLASDGGYDGIDLCDGDRLIWLPEELNQLPPEGSSCATTWSGKPLWVLPVRDAKVHLEVVDEFGVRPTGLVAVVGGRVWRERGEVLTLEDMTVGPAEIFVGADGCHGARVSVVLQRGSQRVAVKLTRR